MAFKMRGANPKGFPMKSPAKHKTKVKKGHNKTYDQYPGHDETVKTYEEHQALIPKPPTKQLEKNIFERGKSKSQAKVRY